MQCSKRSKRAGSGGALDPRPNPGASGRARVEGGLMEVLSIMRQIRKLPGVTVSACSFCARARPKAGKGPLPCPFCGRLVRPGRRRRG
jgi:hypothetical protein